MQLTITASAALRRALPTALVAALLAIGAGGADATVTASDTPAADLRVGHTVKRIVVPGAAQREPRQVDVHLWYPADHQGLSDLPKSLYTSALYGRALIPERWDPLSWRVKAEIAHEDAAVDPHGQPFPVIVFSHGSVNDPINYAHLLERIAGAGFVIAAPSHVTDTQEDVRIDFINEQARQLRQPRLFNCNDGLPPRPLPPLPLPPVADCSRPNTTVPLRMADRAGDISAVLDELPTWFGARIDLSSVGVLGHSRGTLSGLAAAAGSQAWGVDPEPHVKAVMGMASGGTLPVTLQPNLQDITIPTLLVAGGQDRNSAPTINDALFKQIACPVEDPLRPVGCAEPKAEKAFVLLADAHHRSFISTFCDQTQITGAIAQANPRAIFETNAVTGLLTSTAGGRAMDYCSLSTFTTPVDIRPLGRSITGFCITGELVEPIPGPCVTSGDVPTNPTGLDNDQVTQAMTEFAVAFFGTALKRVGNDGPHFTRYLAPKWLQKHEPIVGTAAAFASTDAICPPGQDVVCAD